MNQLVLKKKNELSKKKKGFTLIELIIVIAIIAILAALAIPKFGEVRENANQKTDIATAKNIATIVAQQVSDGSITGNTGEVTSDENDKVASKLDGTSTPKAKAAGKATTFTYKIDDTTGNITVWYKGGNEVYPTWGTPPPTPPTPPSQD